MTSFRLAALATLASTAIGTLMAIALVRYRFHGRRVSNLLLVLPMATPEIVMGASLLSLFLIYSVPLGFTSLLIAHIMFCISFVVVVVRSRLIGFDRSVEDAAADLGATPIETFRYVTLPLLRPGILAAALLAFALSIDDFIVSDFNKGTTETFPIYVFGAAPQGHPGSGQRHCDDALPRNLARHRLRALAGGQGRPARRCSARAGGLSDLRSR